MGNQTCAGLCGVAEGDETKRGEIRNSFIQKDLQLDTHGKDEDE
jgi:hypothetical protein